MKIGLKYIFCNFNLIDYFMNTEILRNCIKRHTYKETFRALNCRPIHHRNIFHSSGNFIYCAISLLDLLLYFYTLTSMNWSYLTWSYLFFAIVWYSSYVFCSYGTCYLTNIFRNKCPVSIVRPPKLFCFMTSPVVWDCLSDK